MMQARTMQCTHMHRRTCTIARNAVGTLLHMARVPTIKRQTHSRTSTWARKCRWPKYAWCKAALSERVRCASHHESCWNHL